HPALPPSLHDALPILASVSSASFQDDPRHYTSRRPGSQSQRLRLAVLLRAVQRRLDERDDLQRLVRVERAAAGLEHLDDALQQLDRKSTRLNSSHQII